MRKTAIYVNHFQHYERVCVCMCVCVFMLVSDNSRICCCSMYPNKYYVHIIHDYGISKVILDAIDAINTALIWSCTAHKVVRFTHIFKIDF